MSVRYCCIFVFIFECCISEISLGSDMLGCLKKFLQDAEGMFLPILHTSFSQPQGATASPGKFIFDIRAAPLILPQSFAFVGPIFYVI